MNNIEYNVYLKSLENGLLIEIKDNIHYNKLKEYPQLWCKVNSYKIVKMELVGIVSKPNENDQYLVFLTEEEVSGKLFHIKEIHKDIFTEIYTFDKGKYDKIKNDMNNINRNAVDYGYEGLEDFLNQFNKLRDENPERML